MIYFTGIRHFYALPAITRSQIFIFCIKPKLGSDHFILLLMRFPGV